MGYKRDLIRTYPKAYSIYLSGTIPTYLPTNHEVLVLNPRPSACFFACILQVAVES